jgi:hypothetical protein
MLAAALALSLLAPPELLPEHREELEVATEGERNVDKARRLFDAGKAAAAQSRWDVAIRYFAESYRYAGRSGALYALGRAHRALYFDSGRDPIQLRLALLRFRQFVERDPGSGNRTRAEEYIAELEPYATLLEGFSEDLVITRLLVHSPTAGALVSVDGGKATRTPITLDVEPGTHRVTVEAPGHHGNERSVDVPEGATVSVELRLDPQPAALHVTGPKGADVYLDGRDVGRLPAAPLEVNAGAHQVAVARAGRATFVRELELGRGQTRSLAVDLPMTTQRKLAFASIGFGAGGLVAAATLTGLALRAQRRARAIQAERESMGVTMARFDQGQRLWRQRDGLRTGAIVTGVVGGALLVTGVILYLTDRPRLAQRLFAPERSR